MRRHLTYANVAATLALVLAMSGSALAARHYLINSTKQINPKVVRKLHSKTGKRGATGARGPQGATGETGPSGSIVPVLPSGATLRGSYDAMTDIASAYGVAGVGFTPALPSAPRVRRVEYGGPPTRECPGSLAAPEAQPGFLCVYEHVRGNARWVGIYDPTTGEPEGASRYGWIARVDSLRRSEAVVSGTWAVTAP